LRVGRSAYGLFDLPAKKGHASAPAITAIGPPLAENVLGWVVASRGAQAANECDKLGESLSYSLRAALNIAVSWEVTEYGGSPEAKLIVFELFKSPNTLSNTLLISSLAWAISRLSLQYRASDNQTFPCDSIKTLATFKSV
jgi:hypothetical protein